MTTTQRRNKAPSSTIFKLHDDLVAAGNCAICGGLVVLRFHDKATGHKFGRCCLEDVIDAMRLLKSQEPVIERRKPQPRPKPAALERQRTPQESAEYMREKLTARLGFFERQNTSAGQQLQSIGQTIETAIASGDKEAEITGRKQSEKLIRHAAFLWFRIEGLREKLSSIEAGTFAPCQFDISEINVESGHLCEGLTLRGSRDGIARPVRPSFYTIGDGTESGELLAQLCHKFSPELGEMLTQGAVVNNTSSKNNTARLTSFLAPNGKVFVLGTFKRSGDYWVTKPDGVWSIQLRAIMAQGFKPFASTLTEQPANNPHYVYDDHVAYNQDFGGALDLMSHARAIAETVLEGMQPTDSETDSDCRIG